LGSSGRGRALASSFAPPAPQAPSTSTNPTTTSAATNMGAADKSLRLIRNPPFVKGTERGVRAGSRRPGLSVSCTIRPGEGAAYHSNGLSLRLLGRCMPITNFGELRQCEVRRMCLMRSSPNSVKRKSNFREFLQGEACRIPLPRTLVNKANTTVASCAATPLRGSTDLRAPTTYRGEASTKRPPRPGTTPRPQGSTPQ
jgi:hypothetical protein